MQQQLMTMLELQDSMNTKVHSDWQDQGFEWYRAIWIECGELLDHYGWKWWKKQTPDVDQVHLELVDIWHFGLSILLTSGKTAQELAATIESELRVATDEVDFRLDLERFAAETLTTQGFSIAAFGRLMAGVELGFEELYIRYVGKNVLNFFRQDNGYQDGSYVKNWAGKEDNEHLVEVTRELDTSSASFKDDLYAALNERYRRLAN